MTYFDDERNRFGWRCWIICPDGHIRAPFARKCYPQNMQGFDAECPHGNDIPSVDCVCGVHYCPSAENLPWLVKRTAQHHFDPNIPPWSTQWFWLDANLRYDDIIVTFGTAVGRIDIDRVLGTDEVYRAKRYVVLDYLRPPHSVERALAMEDYWRRFVRESA